MDDTQDADVPSYDQQVEAAELKHAKLFFDFQREAIRRGWPPRMGKTFWALLWLANRRPKFVTGVPAIMVYSRQSRMTVFRALNDLEFERWLRREHRHQSAGYWYDQSWYEIPRLRDE